MCVKADWIVLLTFEIIYWLQRGDNDTKLTTTVFIYNQGDIRLW